MKSNRTLVKAYALEHGIDFRTVSRARKSPRRFYILRTVLEELPADETVIVSDIHCFAALCLRGSDGTLYIDFTWLQGGRDRLTGWEESVILPYGSLVDFMHGSSQERAARRSGNISPCAQIAARKSYSMTMKGYGNAWRTRQSGESWPAHCGTISAIPVRSRSAFTMTLCRTPFCSKRCGEVVSALWAV